MRGGGRRLRPRPVHPAHARATARPADPVAALRRQFITGRGMTFIDRTSLRGGEVFFRRTGKFQFGPRGVTASDMTGEFHVKARDLELFSEDVRSCFRPEQAIRIGRTVPQGRAHLRLPARRQDLAQVARRSGGRLHRQPGTADQHHRAGDVADADLARHQGQGRLPGHDHLRRAVEDVEVVPRRAGEHEAEGRRGEDRDRPQAVRRRPRADHPPGQLLRRRRPRVSGDHGHRLLRLGQAGVHQAARPWHGGEPHRARRRHRRAADSGDHRPARGPARASRSARRRGAASSRLRRRSRPWPGPSRPPRPR